MSFSIHITVGQTARGAYKVLYVGENQDDAVEEYKSAGEEFREVVVFDRPFGMLFRNPAQDLEMKVARDTDSEVQRMASVAKMRLSAAKLQAESAKQADDARKLLADAEAAEKALAKEPKKVSEQKK